MRDNVLSVGQKIYAIRKAKDMSQEVVADKMSYSRTIISNIERDINHDQSMIIAVKAALGVQGMPLFEEERKAFLDRLFMWNDTISERNFEEAKQIKKELSQIRYLPFEQEFNDLYSLFDCRLMLGEQKFKSAAKILAELETTIDKTNDTIMYWFYSNYGTLVFYNQQYQEALEYYKKAFGLMKGGFEENVSLHYNIAHCLSNLGYYTNVVKFIDDSCNINTGEQITLLDFAFANLLAINLIRWGYVKKANKLLTKCLTKAQKDKNEYYIGTIYYNFGFLYNKDKNWETALYYFDKAFDYLAKGSTIYLGNLYQKARCLVEINDRARCLPLIAEGKELAKDNELYMILFESLEPLMTLKDDSSLEYLETKVLPYLLSKALFSIELDYCEILLEHYEKNNNHTKALKMAAICHTIYKKINEHGVVE